jgi:hypothetical protein
MTTLDRVCAALDRHGIPYALIGAAALASYGVARSTFDIDLLTTDRRVLDAALWAGLTADIRRGDADDPLAGVVRVAEDADRPVDVIVGRHAWQTRSVTRAVKTGGGPPVVQARDLVLLKLYAGGGQDLWDIGELLKQSTHDLAGEVETDLAELPGELRRRWDNRRSGE